MPLPHIREYNGEQPVTTKPGNSTSETTPTTTSTTTTTAATTTTRTNWTEAPVTTQASLADSSLEATEEEEIEVDVGMGVNKTTEAPPVVGAIKSSVVSSNTKAESVVGEGGADDGVALPTIYVITPTFARPEQVAEMTRLSQTLRLVPNLHWIVAEDAQKPNAAVQLLLKNSGLNYTYLLAPMPEVFKKKKGGKPKGVSNRLAGLNWLKSNVQQGVMFFADDDNSYDVRLFQEMRWTKKVSMWPVGLVTQLGLSTPIVRNGSVVGFYDGWIAKRKYPVDMAGFAVNVAFMHSRPNVTMPYQPGYEEDGFLRSLNINLKEVEPKADNCTKILVWHTRTMSNKPPKKLAVADRKKLKGTNLEQILEVL